MRQLLALARLGIKQNAKNPLMTGLLVLAPIMLTFVIGESARNVLPVDNPFDYICVIILTQSITHAAAIGFWSVYRQMRYRTLQRISVSPIGPAAFVCGTALAGFVSAAAFISIVAVGSALFLGVTTGPSPMALLLVIICGTLFSTALGVLIGSISREERSAAGVLSFGVPVLILLGGGYMPIPESGALAAVSPFTPVRCAKTA